MVDTPQDETIKDVKKVILIRPKGTCGCGRSPTGRCVGWHKLTEERFVEINAEYEKMSDSQKEGLLSPKAIDGFGE